MQESDQSIDYMEEERNLGAEPITVMFTNLVQIYVPSLVQYIVPKICL